MGYLNVASLDLGYSGVISKYHRNVDNSVLVFVCSGANILKLINLIKYVNTLTPEHANTVYCPVV